MPSSIKQCTAALLGTLAALGLAGCGSIEPIAPHETVTDPAKLYMRLTLNHPAVNLSTFAPYDTVQLTAIPRDAQGNPITGLPAPTYRLQAAGDTTRVQITEDGLVTAVDVTPTTGIYVIAELTIDGPVTHTDSSLIIVKSLATPPVLASLSIHPGPSDSAVWPVIDPVTGLLDPLLFAGVPPRPHLPSEALDTAGNVISGLAIEYRSLDPRIAVLGRWRGGNASGATGNKANSPGQVRFVARTMAYGVVKVDTVTWTVTWPIGFNVVIREGEFAPSEVRIMSYGLVAWMTQESDTVDLTFDDPTMATMPPASVCDRYIAFQAVFGPGPHCGTGDALVPGATAPGQYFKTLQVRQFMEPGVHSYHSTRTGATGRIVVLDPDDIDEFTQP